MLSYVARAYRFLFYRIYRWARNLHGEADLPQHTALLTVALLVTFNVLTIATIGFVIGIPCLNRPDYGKIVGIPVGIVFLTFQYLYLIRNNGYRNIVEEFEGDGATENPRAIAWVRIYVVSSVLVFWGLLLLVTYTRSVKG